MLLRWKGSGGDVLWVVRARVRLAIKIESVIFDVVRQSGERHTARLLRLITGILQN